MRPMNATAPPPPSPLTSDARYCMASSQDNMALWELRHVVPWRKSHDVSDAEKAGRFFDAVALAFPVIERVVVPEYRDLLARLRLDHDLTALDLGTGTGALAQALAERGHTVTGFDVAGRLLHRARRKLPQCRFEARDITRLDDIDDQSFDIVALGYVLHGMPANLRQDVLRAAHRIARRYVLIIDYRKRGNLFTRLIEWIEGPHYFDFIRVPLSRTLHESGFIVAIRTKTRTGGGAWLCVPKRPIC